MLIQNISFRPSLNLAVVLVDFITVDEIPYYEPLDGLLLMNEFSSVTITCAHQIIIL